MGKNLIEEARKIYRETIYVNCPALNNEPVYFSSSGFNHILYKKSGRRPQKDILSRIRLLPIAVKLLRTANIYQEYEVREIMKPRKEKGEIVYVKTPIEYWGIIAVMGEYKIKVVVKQIKDEKKHFLSVIPNWTTSKNRDGTFVRRFSRGDMADD